jgi:putative transposase
MFGVFHLFLDLIVILARCLRPGGRSALIAEHLLVRQRLIAIRRKRKKAPRLTRLDRVVFAVSSLFIRSRRLPRLSIVVAHSTLLGFHKALVNRKYSKLFSNKKRRRPGPKGPSAELIRLVVDIKLKNPRYGYPKITLLVSKLLDREISEQQVRRILRKHFRNLPPGSGPSWLNAIGHAKDALWSMDLFCSESILLRTHWVMVVMDHFTREMIGIAVSTGPLNGEDAVCMFATIRSGSGRAPKYLSTDHDPLFTFHPWQAGLRILDINEIKTVPEVPWSHPFIERGIGTIRRGFLDEALFWNERDLKAKLDSFLTYYNDARVHSSLSGHTPRGVSGAGMIGKIDLQNYSWKSYCGSRFSVPFAA